MTYIKFVLIGMLVCLAMILLGIAGGIGQLPE